jgi:hypothetical protein
MLSRDGQASIRGKLVPPTAGLSEEGIGVQPLSQQELHPRRANLKIRPYIFLIHNEGTERRITSSLSE